MLELTATTVHWTACVLASPKRLKVPSGCVEVLALACIMNPLNLAGPPVLNKLTAGGGEGNGARLAVHIHQDMYTCEGGSSTWHVGTSQPTDLDGCGGTALLLTGIGVLRGQGDAVIRYHRPKREPLHGKQWQARQTDKEEQRHHLEGWVGLGSEHNMGGADFLQN